MRLRLKAWHRYKERVRYRKVSLEAQIERQRLELKKSQKSPITYSTRISKRDFTKGFKLAFKIFLRPWIISAQKLLKVAYWFRNFYKKLVLKNAYFVNLNPENLSVYNILRIRHVGVADLEYSILEDIHCDTEEVDESLYSEYRHQVAYEFPILTIVSYILVLFGVYIFLYVLVNCGIGILHSQLHKAPTWYNRVQPLTFSFYTFGAFFGMLLGFEIVFSLSACLPFFLLWFTAMDFTNYFYFMESFDYLQNSHNNSWLTRNCCMEEVIPLSKDGTLTKNVWSDKTLLRRTSKMRYFSVLYKAEDKTTEKYSKNIPNELGLSDQLVITFLAFCYLAGKQKDGRRIFYKAEQRAIETQLDMHQYSLVRIRLTELHKNSLTTSQFSVTPTQLVYESLYGQAHRPTFEPLAKLEKAKISNFLELERQRIDTIKKPINLRRKIY